MSAAALGLQSSVVLGEPTTHEEAQEIIETIQGRKGYLSQSTVEWLNSIPGEDKKKGKEVLMKFNANHSDALEYIKSARQINTSDAHFIHELLQNADDARYSKALRRRQQPWIRFHLTKDTIVVETNEDGFTRADVEAICETGKSTKKFHDANKRIGEKGIGFKSIFRIAEKVHITSGLWNFRFEHMDGDDGLGMVTPLLDPPIPLSDEVGTRMTLRLNKRHQNNHARVMQEFEDLPDTTIFFLQNIKCMKTTFTPSESVEPTEITITISGNDKLYPNRGQIVKSVKTRTTGTSSSVSSTMCFHVFRGQDLTMPVDRRRPSGKAHVTVAFPLEEDMETAVIENEGQHVFAFLPLYRKVQLHFLIQSDFITTASRESTEDCDWNDRLRKATANTFCDAIAEMCKQGVLTYQWPKFVPTLPLDNFWKPLRLLIVSGLQARRVLSTWASRTFKLPREVRRLEPSAMHHGLPLLRDRSGAKEIYLDPKYEPYSSLIEELGVEPINWSEILDRLQDDLAHGSSLVKDSLTSNLWHEALASLLLPIYDRPSLVMWQELLTRLDIVPLKAGSTWRSISGAQKGGPSTLYFPTIDGVAVPENIGLGLVNIDAHTSPKRAVLFRRMGVQTCTAQAVLKEILRLHESTSPYLQSAKSAAQHLYLFYRFGKLLHSENRKLWVVTKSLKTVSSTSELYLASDEPYSVDWLLRNERDLEPLANSPDNKWLLHPQYFDPSMRDRPSDKVSWRSWLVHEAGMRVYPVLTTEDVEPKALSLFLQSVLQASSQLFLRILQSRWHGGYSSEYFKSTFPRQILQNCEVLCRNQARVRLTDTYLPSDNVMSHATAIGVCGQNNILSLDLKPKPFALSEWSALRDMEVRDVADVEFHIQALSVMKARDVGDHAMTAYNYIGANAKASQAPDLKAKFNDQKLIHIPPITKPTWFGLHPDSYGLWCSSRDCVWDGPKVLTVKTSLAAHYGRSVYATNLFRTLLCIRDATWQDLVSELEALKSKKTILCGLDTASAIYEELFAMKEVNWEQVKLVFANSRLVCTTSGKWFSPEVCLWTSSVAIEGRPTLAKDYPLQESFFTQKLGVRKADVRQITQELIRKANKPSSLSVAEAKTFIKQISSMMALESSDTLLEEELQELSRSKFLPVQKGTAHSQLVDCDHDFAIRDDLAYSQAFADTCTFLDFSFEELPQVLHLLKALLLEMRNISELVDEKVSVGDDSVLHEDLTRELVLKAPFLFSCAYKYGSSRVSVSDRFLLDNLQRLRVYTCSSIVNELSLEQDGTIIKSSSQKAQVLLETKDDEVRIYVPKDEKQRRSVFRSKLPVELLRFMKIEEDRAQSSVALILTSPLADMEDVMLTENIPIVPWLHASVYNSVPAGLQYQSEVITEVPRAEFEGGRRGSESRITSISGSADQLDESDDELSDNVSDSGVDNHTKSQASRPPFGGFGKPIKEAGFGFGSGASSTPPFTAGPGQTVIPFNFVPLHFGTSRQTNHSPFSFRAEKVSNVRVDTVFGSGGVSSFGSAPSPAPQQQNDYKSLLDQIIKCANNTARSTNGTQNNPGSNGLSLASLSSALPPRFETETTFGPPGRSRDMKIGAAGELFVFERLKGLKLPGFGVGNWQSRIRKYVTEHSSYADMTHWPTRETADIVYDDTTGQLRRWLGEVSCNKLPQSGGSVTKCYIEVKTTSSRDCDEKFYMSNGEYELMKRSRIEANTNADGTYVIVRVFRLMDKDIGFKVFVDPWGSRKDNGLPPGPASLTFEVGKWNVTPSTLGCVRH